MSNLDGHTIFTSRTGEWVVGVYMADGRIAISSATPRLTNEATANLEAIRRHRERPHMNFAVVRKPLLAVNDGAPSSPAAA